MACPVGEGAGERGCLLAYQGSRVPWCPSPGAGVRGALSAPHQLALPSGRSWVPRPAVCPSAPGVQGAPARGRPSGHTRPRELPSRAPAGARLPLAVTLFCFLKSDCPAPSCARKRGCSALGGAEPLAFPGWGWGGLRWPPSADVHAARSLLLTQLLGLGQAPPPPPTSVRAVPFHLLVLAALFPVPRRRGGALHPSLPLPWGPCRGGTPDPGGQGGVKGAQVSRGGHSAHGAPGGFWDRPSVGPQGGEWVGDVTAQWPGGPSVSQACCEPRRGCPGRHVPH